MKATVRAVVLKPRQDAFLDNLQGYHLKDVTIRPNLSAAPGNGQLIIQDYWTKTKMVFEALKGNQPRVIAHIEVNLPGEMLYTVPFSPILRGDIALLWWCTQDIQLATILQLYGGGA